MSDELIDVLHSDLTVAKTVLKSIAHKNGWLHASVHIWLYTSDAKLLVQKRSPTKVAFPNLWDVSVAGHIEAGEPIVQAALREIKEEIGIDYKQSALSYIGDIHETHHHNPNFIDNEIHHIYIGRLFCDISSLKIQKEELTALKLVDLKQLELDLNNSNSAQDYVPHKKEYYTFVLNYLKNLL